MLIKIATYLAGQGLGTVTGQDDLRPIFAYKQAGEHDQAILLVTGSTGEGIENEELPGYYKAELQIIASAGDVITAKDIAQQVSQALTLREVIIEDVVVKRCFPRHRPLVFNKNEGQVVEASVNFDITYYLNV